MQCKMCQAEFQPREQEDVCSACDAKLKAVALDSSGFFGKTLSDWSETNEARHAASRPDAGPQGRQIWKSVGSDGCPVSWPISVAVSSQRDILLLDEPDEYRIMCLDPRGNCLKTLMDITADAEPGGVEDPQGLAADAAGNLFIPDAGNDRISVWTKEGTFSHWVGRSGTKAGQLAHPMDVEVDSDSFLYIADTFNHRIQKMSLDGLVSLVIQDLGVWGKLAEPVAVTVDSSGNIYVADTERGRVFMLDPEGKPLRCMPDSDDGQRLFEQLGDVRVLSDNSMLVSDRSNLRIRRFSTSGS